MERDAILRSLVLLLFFAGLLSRAEGTTSNAWESSTGAPFGVATPMTTIPIINPTNPFATTPVINPTNPSPPADPYTPPPLTTTAAAPVGGRSWCVASPTASQTALQVALDYACGYGGADCAAIQQGGACFSPNTLRDHASFAFNSYYQKNPLPTSCDFGGTAMLTTTDPSSSTCRFPSTSASSPVVIGPTNPAGSGPTVLGSTPPSFGDPAAAAAATYPPSVIFTLACLLLTLFRHR